MKTKRLDQSLLYCTEQEAEKFWLQYRWKDGKPVCPYCGSYDKQYHCADRRYKCGHCKKRYSSMVGTAFQNTKLKMQTIVRGILFLLVTRSASAIVLSANLDITYDTAYFFIKRMLYLCTVKVEVSKIKMESQKEYEDKGCPKGIF